MIVGGFGGGAGRGTRQGKGSLPSERGWRGACFFCFRKVK